MGKSRGLLVTMVVQPGEQMSRERMTAEEVRIPQNLEYTAQGLLVGRERTADEDVWLQ